MSGVRSAISSSCSTATPDDGGGGTQITQIRYGRHRAPRSIGR